MATPPSAVRLLAALKAEGVKVVEVGDWETHNRNSKGPFGSLHGVMIHHTVTKGTKGTVDLCRKGRSDLPGPLAHGVIAKDGTVYLIGHGRANHAGLGDDDVLRAVINEQTLPPDNELNTDGNRYFYGFECENLGDGDDPWPAAQLEAIVRSSAALCRLHSWGARSVIRHLDWQPGKVDPRGVNWGSIQERIADRLGSKPPTQPLPTPQRPVVDLSKLIAAAKSDPARSGTPVTYKGVATVEAALTDAGLLTAPYADGHWGTKTTPAYAAWQRSKAGGGYRGKAADGIPGHDSLTRLGRKYGFTVVA